MTDTGLPFIKRTYKKVVPTGEVIEEITLEVHGKTLKEVETVFNKKWKKK